MKIVLSPLEPETEHHFFSDTAAEDLVASHLPTSRIHFYVWRIGYAFIHAYDGRCRLYEDRGRLEDSTAMQVTIDLPEDVVMELQAKWDNVERGVLETIALEGYRFGSLTTEQVRRMLGYGTRMQVDEFLKRNDVYLEYTEDDFSHDAETSRRLKAK